jgi:YD repeat-containing protein
MRRVNPRLAHTSYDPVGNLTNINYPTSPDVTFGYDSLNRVTEMVDAVGTTAYGYTAGGVCGPSGNPPRHSKSTPL